MIQLSNKICMFAPVSRPRELTYYRFVWAFFMSVLKLVSSRYKAACPLCWLHTITIVVVSLVGKREASSLFSFKFQTTMTKDFEICNAANNSTCTATSAHETRAVQLTGNPFRDFSLYNLTLHGYQIKYLRGVNRNNHSITGRFNVSGRIYTFGANTYEEAIKFVVFKVNQYHAFVRERRRRKREQQIQA